MHTVISKFKLSANISSLVVLVITNWAHTISNENLLRSWGNVPRVSSSLIVAHYVLLGECTIVVPATRSCLEIGFMAIKRQARICSLNVDLFLLEVLFKCRQSRLSANKAVSFG